MGERTALHGFFRGHASTFAEFLKLVRTGHLLLVLAVVIGKMLAAQAYKQSELSGARLHPLKLSIASGMLCGEPAWSDRLRFERS